MELGEKLKQARLELGMSQRQVCGDVITRNMLSQIENGTARPSMETLRYLSFRLGKTVSYFLEDHAVTSVNQTVMEQARAAFYAADASGVRSALELYRSPDPVFDEEYRLLWRLSALQLAQQAAQEGKKRYAVELLEQLGTLQDGYCADELEHRRLLLLAAAAPQRGREICRALSSLDDELLIRARDALDAGDLSRSAALLDAAEDQQAPWWNFLRGEVYLAQQGYSEAAVCYHKAEEVYPAETAPRLERCYRQMENFERAYFYACKQRGTGTTE